MSQLSVPVFRIQHVMQLTVNTASKMLATEHSDMGNMPLHSQLYDDACDVGLAMLNTQTGVETRWYWIRDERDVEGELQVSIFGPCHESVRKTPALNGWVLHVLND